MLLVYTVGVLLRSLFALSTMCRSIKIDLHIYRLVASVNVLLDHVIRTSSFEPFQHRGRDCGQDTRRFPTGVNCWLGLSLFAERKSNKQAPPAGWADAGAELCFEFRFYSTAVSHTVAGPSSTALLCR